VSVAEVLGLALLVNSLLNSSDIVNVVATEASDRRHDLILSRGLQWISTE